MKIYHSTSRLRAPAKGERGSIVEGALTLSVFVVGAFLIYTKHWIPMQHATIQSIARSQASMSIPAYGATGKVVNLNLTVSESATTLANDITDLRSSLVQNNYPNVDQVCFHIVKVDLDTDDDGECDDAPVATFHLADPSEFNCWSAVWPQAKCEAPAAGAGKTCPEDFVICKEDLRTGEVRIIRTEENLL